MHTFQIAVRNIIIWRWIPPLSKQSIFIQNPTPFKDLYIFIKQAGEAKRRLKFQWKIILLETMNDESYPLAAYSNLYVLVLA